MTTEKRPLSLQELSDLGYEADCKAGWIDPNNPSQKSADQSFVEFIALTHSELSEALEDFRKGHAPNEVWYEGADGKKPCGIPSEMADVVIRVIGACRKHGIDLQAAVEEKLAFNATRPFRHGGKKI